MEDKVHRFGHYGTAPLQVRLKHSGSAAKQLEEENRKLKSLVADLSRDKHMLQEVIAKKL